LKKIYIILIILIFNITGLFANEKNLINLAQKYYGKEMYYNSISELMRYQYLFPKGEYFPESLNLMGKAYFKGDNYNLAIYSFSQCYKKFPSAPKGEESLYLAGLLRIKQGSPFYAIRSFQQYRYIYKKGEYLENTEFNIAYAYALSDNFDLAKKQISIYKKNYPNGEFIDDSNLLLQNISDEINRPKKSIWIAALGSMICPGFGHIYTGNYSTGIFSFLTNITLISLIYNGYRKENHFQMFFFSAIELSFYQHSLYEGINNAYKYNSKETFYKKVRLSIGTEF